MNLPVLLTLAFLLVYVACAEAQSKRYGHDVWGKGTPRRFLSDKHWATPLKWDADAAVTGRPALVFCASMADVFEARDDLDVHRERLWALIEATPHLIWQLLTKRPEQVAVWPSNVWLGTTVEDQERANLRIPRLLDGPASMRFLSCEPLLGPVDLVGRNGYPDIGWVIVGGESGPGHRPMDVEHARVLRDQCEEAGIPFFFKQHGGHLPTSGGDQLDGRTLKAFPASAGVR